jgi:TfoX/Sxy family transcriptional regulator of competence genes
MSEAADELAERIRALIGYKPGVTEKKMFGGYGFMLNGNMVCGAMSTGYLLMRVGPDLHAEAVTRPGAQAMNHGGREMVGFVEVTDDIDEDENLKAWIDYAWAFVKTLPPKAEKVPTAKKAFAKKAAAKTAAKGPRPRTAQARR